jgi:hypothetical protein
MGGLFALAVVMVPAASEARARCGHRHHCRAVTRPVGSRPLPDRLAARLVRHSTWEPKPSNRDENRRVPTRAEIADFYRRSDMTYKRRVAGRFRGTTDEILQWAAHKHGLNENLVRAVAVKESWWRMSTVGDNGDSFGIFQIRRPYHCCVPLARGSTAFNADYWGAIIRSYFDGRETWLNTVERGRRYRAGDIWGSIGAWFAGRWHTPGADGYIRDVRRIMREHTWRTHGFRDARAGGV